MRGYDPRARCQAILDALRAGQTASIVTLTRRHGEAVREALLAMGADELLLCGFSIIVLAEEPFPKAPLDTFWHP